MKENIRRGAYIKKNIRKGTYTKKDTTKRDIYKNWKKSAFD